MKINLPVTQTERFLEPGKLIVTKTDLKGAITYANNSFVRISGFTREELVGHNRNVVRHPDMPPEAFAELWATISAANPGAAWSRTGPRTAISTGSRPSSRRCASTARSSVTCR